MTVEELEICLLVFILIIVLSPYVGWFLEIIIESCHLKEKKKDKIEDIDVVHKECLKGENK